MIQCILKLLDGNTKACLELETNGHTFSEVERALVLFIEALQERLDKREKCPEFDGSKAVLSSTKGGSSSA